MFKNTRIKKAIGLMLVLLASTVVVIASCSNNTPTPYTDVKPQIRNFTLYVRSTYVKTPDGQKIFAFGYTDDPMVLRKFLVLPLRSMNAIRSMFISSIKKH